MGLMGVEIEEGDVWFRDRDLEASGAEVIGAVVLRMMRNCCVHCVRLASVEMVVARGG